MPAKVENPITTAIVHGALPAGLVAFGAALRDLGDPESADVRGEALTMLAGGAVAGAMLGSMFLLMENVKDGTPAMIALRLCTHLIGIGVGELFKLTAVSYPLILADSLIGLAGCAGAALSVAGAIVMLGAILNAAEKCLNCCSGEPEDTAQHTETATHVIALPTVLESEHRDKTGSPVQELSVQVLEDLELELSDSSFPQAEAKVLGPQISSFIQLVCLEKRSPVQTEAVAQKVETEVYSIV